MVDWLARHGVDEVIMACGFKAEELREALGDAVPGGPSIVYIEEDEPLGTAGPIRLAADRGLLGERFMAINGDLLTDLDLTALAAQPRGDRCARDDRPAPGRGPELLRARPPRRGRRGARVPREARSRGDRYRRGQRRRLRDRARGHRPDPARARGLDRARGLSPPGRPRASTGCGWTATGWTSGRPERYLQASWDILEGTVETELAGTGGPYRRPRRRGRRRRRRRAARGRRAVARGSPTARWSPKACCSTSCRVGAEAEIHGSILARGVEVGEGATSARARDRRGRADRARRHGRAAARGSRPASDRCRGRRHERALAAIRAVDPSGQLDDVLALPDHLRDALWRVESAGLEPDEASGLIVCGMGGSAIGGVLARAALGDQLGPPMPVFRDYEMPPWTPPDRAVLCSSYSGNTEETLACFEAAEAVGAQR